MLTRSMRSPHCRCCHSNDSVTHIWKIIVATSFTDRRGTNRHFFDRWQGRVKNQSIILCTCRVVLTAILLAIGAFKDPIVTPESLWPLLHVTILYHNNSSMAGKPEAKLFGDITPVSPLDLCPDDDVSSVESANGQQVVPLPPYAQVPP